MEIGTVRFDSKGRISFASGRPLLVVLAGPNGAGKSTFYNNVISPHKLPFINADLISKEMAGKGKRISDEEAAKLAGKARREHLNKRVDFCMETVFSDSKGHKRDFLRLAQSAGYMVVLVFIGLDSPELSHARVMSRVDGGGHAVPPDKLDERFPRTIENLRLAIPHLDHVYLYDNSSYDYPYRLVALCNSGKVQMLLPPIPWWVSKVLPDLGKHESAKSFTAEAEKVFRKLLGNRGA